MHSFHNANISYKNNSDNLPDDADLPIGGADQRDVAEDPILPLGGCQEGRG